MMNRYVILHHTGFGEPHYDLMFESSPESALMTWRANAWPVVAGDKLRRIGDHRRDYLEYEGAVSNNRGSVARIAAGTCELSMASTQITIRLIEPNAMLIILQATTGDDWRVVEVSP